MAKISGPTPDDGRFRFKVPAGLPPRDDYFVRVSKQSLTYFSEWFSVSRGWAAHHIWFVIVLKGPKRPKALTTIYFTLPQIGCVKFNHFRLQISRPDRKYKEYKTAVGRLLYIYIYVYIIWLRILGTNMLRVRGETALQSAGMAESNARCVNIFDPL